MEVHLIQEKVWLDKNKYEEAERIYYENKAKDFRTPLAAEVGRAREWLTNIKNCIAEPSETNSGNNTSNTLKFEEHIKKLQEMIVSFEKELKGLSNRVNVLEESVNKVKPVTHAVNLSGVPKVPIEKDKNADDDVDLFESESEEDEAAVQIRQKRLADYEAKKSKKPVLIAKSNIILDIKPWDDETDMKCMETAVRAIQMEGLVWGVSKLVPLAYGIYKLQIACVVEDDLVSVDSLQEQIEGIADYVQSVDVAAFNKV